MQVAEAREGYEAKLSEWLNREKAAVELINCVGRLMYEKGVELVFFRNHLLDVSISEVLQLFDYAKDVVCKPIDVETTSKVAQALLKYDIAPSKIDIGKLTKEIIDAGEGLERLDNIVIDKLGDFIGEDKNTVLPKDVVLFGFGRIGRLVARELVKQFGKGQQLRLRAIVTRTVKPVEVEKRASLLRNDSVHGSFKGSVHADVEKKRIIVNGQIIQLIEAGNPEDVDYTSYGIKDALLIDNTGVFKDREALSRHLKAKGISKVILTAPGKEVPNIVYGINQKDLDLENETIFSAASCTTNAICPVLKVIQDNIGIERGHIETVHAYTNDQNLLDNMHKNTRRGRSAAINMVITETGAGKAVTKVIPELKNKLTANAVRVPVPNGSLAILSLQLKQSTSLEDINNLMRSAALEGDLVNQINYRIDEELVSSDIIGNSCCSVFDSKATIVSEEGKNIVLYVWYDNEFGYTKQVIRLAKHVAKVRRLIYY